VVDTGPDHDKTFTAVVVVDGAEVGRGVGRSKKQAEQTAAREAYRTISARAETAGRDPVR